MVSLKNESDSVTYCFSKLPCLNVNKTPNSSRRVGTHSGQIRRRRFRTASPPSRRAVTACMCPENMPVCVFTFTVPYSNLFNPQTSPAQLYGECCHTPQIDTRAQPVRLVMRLHRDSSPQNFARLLSSSVTKM